MLAAALSGSPAFAQADHSHHNAPPAPIDHSKMNHGSEPAEDLQPITGTPNKEPAAGSGTSRLPGNEGMMHGVHLTSGDWMVMFHGYAWSTYSNQGGPRGDKQAFVTSMAMAEASRDLGMTTKLQLRAMLSLDPLIGKRGYPNLFATGETANGIPLVDRQHPHDFFMELSARVDQDLGGGVTGFLYGGPVAEPALGPSAFMHRRSAKLNPEAPITHHWFDSTHITFGVVTAGIATSALQFEASAFRGREPDEARWNVETPKLDSWSVRGTWTPSANWAVSVSHGFLKSPEPREPLDNEKRTVAAVNYADQKLSITAAYSYKVHGGDGHGAFLAEANWDITPRHAFFGRFEHVDNDELFDSADPLGGDSYAVSKATLGYAYTLPLGPFGLSLGGSASAYAKPSVLDLPYGRNPKSFTLFAKLGLGG
jgi:hypothetical protein